MTNLFEQASRLKLRFQSPRGLLTVEDLWDLPLKAKKEEAVRKEANLDDLAKALHKEVKEAEEPSFVEDKSPASEKLDLMFELVKYIINVKKAEEAARKQQVAKAESRQEILELIHEKKKEARKNLSIEELEALL